MFYSMLQKLVKGDLSFFLSCYSLFPKVCEMKADDGEVCVASFDWKCSGVCKSVDRMWLVHAVCGEGDRAVWDANL